MENNKPAKVFVNGLISKDIPETTPEFILGRLSVKAEDLHNWLRENKGLCDENGWMNLTILRSKTSGKRYIEVDTWKPTKAPEVKDESPSVKVGGYEGPIANGEVPVADIPF